MTWLGDWVAVASGLGVRVSSDGRQAVTVTVDTELRGGTRGLCGPYNDDPAGKHHLAGRAARSPRWARRRAGAVGRIQPPLCP